MDNRTYLGDSVYVETVNGMLLLTTNNGFDDDPRNTIYLEPEVYANLLKYVNSIGAEDFAAGT